jgi:hypothetical protein
MTNGRRLRSCGLHGLTTLYETRKLFRFETGTGLSQSTYYLTLIHVYSVRVSTYTDDHETRNMKRGVSLFGNFVSQSSLRVLRHQVMMGIITLSSENE